MLPSRYIVNAILCTLVAAAPAQVEPELVTKRGVVLNTFLALVVKLFPVNTVVDSACGTLNTGQQLLAAVFNLDTTQSSSSSCKDVTVIFARGTCDPGNVGALVGPPFFKAIEDKLPGKSINFQGVEYPASVGGYLSADGTAGQKMTALVKSTWSSCPKTKIVLSGYSQGGFAVHNAADSLGKTMSNVSAVVVFGDPLSRKPVNNIDSSRVRIVCHEGDDICAQGVFILPQHLTYAVDAASAADFIAARV